MAWVDGKDRWWLDFAGLKSRVCWTLTLFKFGVIWGIGEEIVDSCDPMASFCVLVQGDLCFVVQNRKFGYIELVQLNDELRITSPVTVDTDNYGLWDLLYNNNSQYDPTYTGSGEIQMWATLPL